MKLICTILFILLTVFMLPGLSQNFAIYTSTNSSLPYNSIYCIDFDRNGNIWFGGQPL